MSLRNAVRLLQYTQECFRRITASYADQAWLTIRFCQIQQRDRFTPSHYDRAPPCLTDLFDDGFRGNPLWTCVYRYRAERRKRLGIGNWFRKLTQRRAYRVTQVLKSASKLNNR